MIVTPTFRFLGPSRRDGLFLWFFRGDAPSGTKVTCGAVHSWGLSLVISPHDGAFIYLQGNRLDGGPAWAAPQRWKPLMSITSLPTMRPASSSA